MKEYGYAKFDIDKQDCKHLFEPLSKLLVDLMWGESLNVGIEIRENSTGVVLKFERDGESLYDWFCGSHSCDCIRRSLFTGLGGPEDLYTSGLYSVLIKDRLTGEVYCDEFGRDRPIKQTCMHDPRKI
jgi:hypothetical protein